MWGPIITEIQPKDGTGDMKLEIPDPDEPTTTQHSHALSMELTISLALSALLVLAGWLWWIQPQQHQAGDDGDATAAQTERTSEPAMPSEEPGRHDQLTVGDHEPSEARLKQIAQVFEAGPRSASEQACDYLSDNIVTGQLTRDVERPLRQSVARLGDSAPYGCLLRLYLEQGLPSDSELTHEVERFWNSIAALDDHGDVMASVVEHFQRNSAPDAGMFDHWLRRCALAVDDYPAAPQCRQLVQQRHPQINDPLELVLAHLSTPGISSTQFNDEFAFDFEIATDVLTHLARYGQPDDWKIAETEVLPNYDADIRLASTFQLCRLMNAPHDEIQAHAAAGLGYIAEVADRPHNPYMPYRWRKTCRLAFGDLDAPQGDVPLLGVASHDGDDTTVDYGLGALIEHELCDQYDGYPSWYCGAEAWTGDEESLRQAMGMHFAETGYVEWYELDELAEQIPAPPE